VLRPVGLVSKKKSGKGTQLSLVIAGDRRLAENVVVEVRAIAQRLGMEIPKIEVVRQPSARLKAKRQRSVRRKAK
jgi:hypothetical protein